LFQSTHPCGVRRRIAICCCPSDCFNPRTRAGCDLSAIRQIDDQKAVSIHAPVRGATRQGHGISGTVQCFNPRTRAGCDPGVGYCTKKGRCFNPRTRAGCDSNIKKR